MHKSEDCNFNDCYYGKLYRNVYLMVMFKAIDGRKLIHHQKIILRMVFLCFKITLLLNVLKI